VIRRKVIIANVKVLWLLNVAQIQSNKDEMVNRYECGGMQACSF
jgi:hypothetical protein